MVLTRALLVHQEVRGRPEPVMTLEELRVFLRATRVQKKEFEQFFMTLDLDINGGWITPRYPLRAVRY